MVIYSYRKGKQPKKRRKNTMVAYGIAKARAMANRTDWNERTEITKAVITWFDADYEYELEIENEGRMDNEEFTAWVEENAESLAKADAEENGTTFEEIDSIDFTEKEIDDDALFDEEYENACEFEWECQPGRYPKTHNPRPKPPKGAAARTAAVLPCPAWFRFLRVVFPFSQMPHTGQRGACFLVGIIHNFLPFSLCRICRKFR